MVDGDVWQRWEEVKAATRAQLSSYQPDPSLRALVRSLRAHPEVATLARAAGLSAWPVLPALDRSFEPSDLIRRTAALRDADAVMEEVHRTVERELRQCEEMHKAMQARRASSKKRTASGSQSAAPTPDTTRVIMAAPTTYSRLKTFLTVGNRAVLAANIFSMDVQDAKCIMLDFVQHAMFSWFLHQVEPDVAACTTMQFNVRAAYVQIRGQWMAALVSESEYARGVSANECSVRLTADEARARASRRLGALSKQGDAEMPDGEMCKRLLLVLSSMCSVAMFHSVCGTTHGDLHQMNLVVTDHLHVRLIDFDLHHQPLCTRYLASADAVACPIAAEGCLDFVTHEEVFSCGFDLSTGNATRAAGVSRCGTMSRHVDLVMMLNEMPWRAFDRGARTPLPGFLMRALECPDLLAAAGHAPLVCAWVRRIAIMWFAANITVSADGWIDGPSFLSPFLTTSCPTMIMWHLATTAAIVAQCHTLPFAHEHACLRFMMHAPDDASVETKEGASLACMNALHAMRTTDEVPRILERVLARVSVEDWCAMQRTSAPPRVRAACPDAMVRPTPTRPAMHSEGEWSVVFLAALRSIQASFGLGPAAHLEPFAAMRMIAAARRCSTSIAHALQDVCAGIAKSDADFQKHSKPIERFFLAVHSVDDVAAIHRFLTTEDKWFAAA
jgi:hypothetical protein